MRSLYTMGFGCPNSYTLNSRSLQQAPECVLGPEPGAAVLAALLDDPQGVPWRALASGTPEALAQAVRYRFWN